MFLKELEQDWRTTYDTRRCVYSGISYFCLLGRSWLVGLGGSMKPKKVLKKLKKYIHKRRDMAHAAWEDSFGISSTAFAWGYLKALEHVENKIKELEGKDEK